MSPNQNQPPVKIVVSDSFYEILLHKRAQDNERLAAQGLPPRTDELSYISKSEADALDADEAKRRTSQANAQEAAKHAPPPPTRGPLCRAAKAKVAERIASIPGFERHSRKCQICRSPYVTHIEDLFLQWESVQRICRYFQLEDADTIYRHARAARLDATRRGNVRHVVEQFIEQWRNVKITSSAVLRSIRALSCLDDKGHWTDLPKTHILLRANDATASTERSEPRPSDVSLTAHSSDSGLPEAGSVASSAPSFERIEPTLSRDGACSAHSPALDSPFIARELAGCPSSERSEPLFERVGDERIATSTSAVRSALSTERSEPHQSEMSSTGHSSGSGLPQCGVTSSTDSHDAGEQSPPFSLERSEPKHRKGTASAVPKDHSDPGVLTPEVSTSDNRQIVASILSTERSEPHENSSPESENESPVVNISEAQEDASVADH